MSETVTAEKATERLKVEVTLNVTHRVTVRMDGDSGQSMEDLKAAALAEFHRDPNRRGIARNEDTWRFQFANRSNLSVGPENVSIAAVTTKPLGASS